MDNRKSVILSVSGHAIIIMLSIIIGLASREKILPPVPVEVNLLAPSEQMKDAGPPVQAIKKKPKKEPKKEYEIIDKTIEKPKPTYDPTADLAKLENLLKDKKLEEVKDTAPDEVTSTTVKRGGVYGSSSLYENQIKQIIKRNWVKPSRAVLGSSPPDVLVIITVNKNGSITAKRITSASNISRLDESVLEAIVNSNPLPRFPSYMAGASKSFPLRFKIED